MKFITRQLLFLTFVSLIGCSNNNKIQFKANELPASYYKFINLIHKKIEVKKSECTIDTIFFDKITKYFAIQKNIINHLKHTKARFVVINCIRNKSAFWYAPWSFDSNGIPIGSILLIDESSINEANLNKLKDRDVYLIKRKQWVKLEKKILALIKSKGGMIWPDSGESKIYIALYQNKAFYTKELTGVLRPKPPINCDESTKQVWIDTLCFLIKLADKDRVFGKPFSDFMQDIWARIYNSYFP